MVANGFAPSASGISLPSTTIMPLWHSFPGPFSSCPLRFVTPSVPDPSLLNPEPPIGWTVIWRTYKLLRKVLPHLSFVVGKEETTYLSLSKCSVEGAVDEGASNFVCGVCKNARCSGEKHARCVQRPRIEDVACRPSMSELPGYHHGSLWDISGSFRHCRLVHMVLEDGFSDGIISGVIFLADHNMWE